MSDVKAIEEAVRALPPGGLAEFRQWFAEFNKSGAWGRCPVRFVVSEDHGDLITQIQRELIQFYVDKEFGTAAKPKMRPKPVVKLQQRFG